MKDVKDDMEEKLKARLETLRQEFTAGSEQLQQMEAQAAEIRQTLLRISGAVQVLEEELGMSTADDGEAG